MVVGGDINIRKSSIADDLDIRSVSLNMGGELSEACTTVGSLEPDRASITHSVLLEDSKDDPFKEYDPNDNSIYRMFFGKLRQILKVTDS